MITSTDSVETLVPRAYNCFARGDIPGVLACFSPDITWTIPGPTSLAGTYRGHQGVGDFFSRLARTWTRLELTINEVVAVGERAFVLGEHDGEGPGAAFHVAFVHVWQVNDGLATRFTEYTDTETLGRSVGRAAAGSASVPVSR